MEIQGERAESCRISAVFFQMSEDIGVKAVMEALLQRSIDVAGTETLAADENYHELFRRTSIGLS